MAWRYLYDILGVAPTASAAQIARAYRRLADQYHPALNPTPDAAERWAKISQAYAVLADPATRRQYDQRGHAGLTGPDELASRVFAGPPDRSSFPGPGPGPGPGAPPAARRGADLRCALRISAAEAARGIVRVVEIPRVERCAACQGSGATPPTQRAPCPQCGGHGTLQHVAVQPGAVSRAAACARCAGSGAIGIASVALPGGQGLLVNPPCQACQGRGSVRRSHAVRVAVPAGAVHGQQLRLRGAGAPSRDGGLAGDLCVALQVL